MSYEDKDSEIESILEECEQEQELLASEPSKEFEISELGKLL